jgi:hypothetical protein
MICRALQAIREKLRNGTDCLHIIQHSDTARQRKSGMIRKIKHPLFFKKMKKAVSFYGF